ncbi:MAG: GNAT family N-acetyltransferase [Nitrospirae bacterium GWC2_42_7]|nr:MAG: GNAT family N-acetyltransferase [Nitrospirae bacterium GWC2_42_7]
MDITLKPLGLKHKEQVINIYNCYIENSFAAYPESRVPYEFFEQLLKMCEGYPSAVAEDEGGNVLGFGLLRPYHTFPVFSRTAFITYFIKPEFRHKGIGKQILEYLIVKGKEKGIASVLADISSLNIQSIDFHRKNGFMECGRFENVGVKNGKIFDVVYMQKKL